MSREASVATGRPYGVKRVCSVWETPRSTVYLRRSRAAEAASDRRLPRRRGPKMRLSDDELLEMILAYLEGSPFAGEGHRKVYAHLKIVKGVRTSRTRVLRLMREHALLSPFRHGAFASPHDGTITTGAPNLLWGTDGFRVQTVDEGWVWGFIAVDHFNSECVGHHVCKEGSRFNALEPIRMGIEKIFGSVGRDAALGLALRMDHGCQYTSDHFLNQIAYWGIAQSFSFVAQPQGNGIAERFIKTLKQQAIYGRVFRNAQEVQETVAAFVQHYNHHWRIERLRFLTPAEARHLAQHDQAA
ncbi:MAG: transposase [Conexivisphaera sp.]